MCFLFMHTKCSLANPFSGRYRRFYAEYPNYVISSYANLPYTNNPHNQYFMDPCDSRVIWCNNNVNLLIKCFQYGDYRARSI
ncbi:MAG: hypothetical protein CM15mP58_17950 [Burkholderiaceae bacterium]|nr:MAG: hypothetical protein CM15mP58_17950 [Burkholderiaceae bacterium]